MDITLVIILLVTAASLSAAVCYLVLRPKIKNVISRNIETEQENLKIEEENKRLKRNNEKLQVAKKEEEENIFEMRQIFSNLSAQREQLRDNLKDLKATQTQAAQDYYDQALTIAQNSFDQEIENISCDLTKAREEAQEEYLNTLEEAVNDFQKEIDKKHQELGKLITRLAQCHKDVAIATEAAKRKLEMETNREFYRLNLSDEDINEIQKLREVLPYLRDKEPLNKVIYKVYYEKPYTDLIGRVLPGQKTYCGIYKITNTLNGMCYVGQSVNVAERWRQHIKRGVGAEAPTRNKLYPAMLKAGVENFTFELVEECPREKLDGREDYWQNYFHAKDFGYSIK